jgi:Transposase DDE domain/Insertion element 4 transposase N-terminal
MAFIGNALGILHRSPATFTLEACSRVLKSEWIGEAADSAPRRTRRRRKLPGRFVVWLMVALSLLRDLSILNVLKRLGHGLGMPSIWRDGRVPSSAAIVEARDRLGFGALRNLSARLQRWILETHREDMNWKGMLVLVLDGTTLKVPDSDENRRHFGLPGVNRGKRSAFPQMRTLVAVSLRLRFILGAWFAPYRRGELTVAKRILSELPQRSLLVLDRLYLAWRFLLEAQGLGHHYLVRAPKHVRGRRLCQLGTGDHLVEIRVHRQARRGAPHLPKRVIARELTVRIRGRWFRYYTTLLDHAIYPAADLINLYARRWEVETSIDEIKTHQSHATTVNRPLILRSQSARRVLQEAHALVVAYNVIRAVMVEAAAVHARDPLRISFVDTLVRLQEALLTMAAAPTQELPRIYEALLRSITEHLLPTRERSNPREVCIKMSSYRKKWKRA